MSDFQKVGDLQHIVLVNDLVCFLNYLRCPGASKIKILLLGVMDASEKPEIIRMRALRLSHNENEK